MDFKHLFRTVVIGGSVLCSGCSATATSLQGASESSARSDTQKTPFSTDVDALGQQCAQVCDKILPGGETICPDPSKKDIKNCCWLMLRRHPCCPK